LRRVRQNPSKPSQAGWERKEAGRLARGGRDSVGRQARAGRGDAGRGGGGIRSAAAR